MKSNIGNCNRSNHTHTHCRLTALFLGLSGWAGTRKVKPIWILLKQEKVSGNDISWAICKSASRSRQTTTPAPDHSVFTGRMPFLPPNQQRQSTEGIWRPTTNVKTLKAIQYPTNNTVIMKYYTEEKRSRTCLHIDVPNAHWNWHAPHRYCNKCHTYTGTASFG